MKFIININNMDEPNEWANLTFMWQGYIRNTLLSAFLKRKNSEVHIKILSSFSPLTQAAFFYSISEVDMINQFRSYPAIETTKYREDEDYGESLQKKINRAPEWGDKYMNIFVELKDLELEERSAYLNNLPFLQPLDKSIITALVIQWCYDGLSYLSESNNFVERSDCNVMDVYSNYLNSNLDPLPTAVDDIFYYIDLVIENTTFSNVTTLINQLMYREGPYTRVQFLKQYSPFEQAAILSSLNEEQRNIVFPDYPKVLNDSLSYEIDQDSQHCLTHFLMALAIKNKNADARLFYMIKHNEWMKMSDKIVMFSLFIALEELIYYPKKRKLLLAKINESVITKQYITNTEGFSTSTVKSLINDDLVATKNIQQLVLKFIIK